MKLLSDVVTGILFPLKRPLSQLVSKTYSSYYSLLIYKYETQDVLGWKVRAMPIFKTDEIKAFLTFTVEEKTSSY